LFLFFFFSVEWRRGFTNLDLILAAAYQKIRVIFYENLVRLGLTSNTALLSEKILDFKIVYYVLSQNVIVSRLNSNRTRPGYESRAVPLLV
jgi:hypothetical protein